MVTRWERWIGVLAGMLTIISFLQVWGPQLWSPKTQDWWHRVTFWNVLFFMSIASLLVVVGRHYWHLRRALASITHTALGNVLAVSLVTQQDAIGVTCSVWFYALKAGARTAPSELALQIPNENGPSGMLCQLRSPRPSELIGPGQWVIAQYDGVIKVGDRERLGRAILAALGPGFALRDIGQVFAAVEVRLPDGHALDAHAQSGVRFGLPPGIAGRPSIIVPIANWQDGVPETWQ